MAGFKTIYSRDGTPVTDIRAAVTRSWLLNDIGEAVFLISTNSPKCKAEYLEYGNYIVAKHADLPDWVGMIDTPRIWHNGYVEVHAYEPMSLLKYRYAPLNYKITGTPGEKVTNLIGQANTQSETLISTGVIDLTGESIEETFNNNIAFHITDLCKRYLMEWITYPSISTAGRLSIGLDFVSSVGIITDAELAQGKNIMFGDVPLEESGELLNEVEAVVEANDVLSESYTYTIAAPYGLRAGRLFFRGVGTDALAPLAQNAAEAQYRAKISTPLTAVNTGQVFANIRLGNTLNYIYPKARFSGNGLGSSSTVRLAGFRYDETLDTCELFVENTA